MPVIAGIFISFVLRQPLACYSFHFTSGAAITGFFLCENGVKPTPLFTATQQFFIILPPILKTFT
jgi:hypothetical protein